MKIRTLATTITAFAVALGTLVIAAPPAHAASPDVPLGDWGSVVYTSAGCTPDSSMITVAALIACQDQSTSTMAWLAPASDGGSPVLDYDVQVAPTASLGSSVPSGPYVTVATVSAATRQYTITKADRDAAGVPAVGTFVVNVRARNADGFSADNPVPLGIYPNPATNGLLPMNFGTPAQTALTAEFTLPVVARNYPGVTATTDIDAEWRLATGPGPRTAAGSTPVVAGLATVTLNGFPGNQAIEFRLRPTAGAALGAWDTLGPLTGTLPVPGAVVLTSALSSVSACPAEADSALLTSCYDNVTQTLTWPTPADNGVAITGYEVETTVDGGTWTPRAGLPAGTNTLVVSQAYRQAAGITAFQAYRVRIRATNVNGAGSWGIHGQGTHCATGAFTAGPCALSSTSRTADGTTANVSAKAIIAPVSPVVDTIEYGYRPTTALPAATVVAGSSAVVGVAPVAASFALPDPSVTYVISVRGVAAGTPGPWQDGTFAGYVPLAPSGGGSGSGGGDSTPATPSSPGTEATQTAPDTPATPSASPDDLSKWTVGARMATRFKKKSAVLRPKARADIDLFIESLQSVQPGMTIGVYGFSPAQSNTAAARASRLRANRVAAYLRAHGVPVVHVSKGLSRKDAKAVFGPSSRIKHNRTVVMLALSPLPVLEQAPTPTDPDLELPRKTELATWDRPAAMTSVPAQLQKEQSS